MAASRSVYYASAGLVILLAGIALIFIPPHEFGLGILLLIVSSIPFSLAYSHSMRAVRQLSH